MALSTAIIKNASKITYLDLDIQKYDEILDCRFFYLLSRANSGILCKSRTNEVN